MSLVEEYRRTLHQLVEDSNGIGAESLTNIDEDQLQIVSMLHTQLAINLLKTESYVESPERDNEGRVVGLSAPFEGLYVTYVVNEDPGEILSLSERIQDLDLWTAKHPDFLGTETDGRSIILGSHDGFVYYGNGLITYHGTILELPRQQAFLLGYFLQNYNSYLTAEGILESVDLQLEDLMGPGRAKRASMVVSKLNVVLADLIGYQPITSHAGRGWILSFPLTRPDDI